MGLGLATREGNALADHMPPMSAPVVRAGRAWSVRYTPNGLPSDATPTMTIIDAAFNPPRLLLQDMAVEGAF